MRVLILGGQGMLGHKLFQTLTALGTPLTHTLRFVVQMAPGPIALCSETERAPFPE